MMTDQTGNICVSLADYKFRLDDVNTVAQKNRSFVKKSEKISNLQNFTSNLRDALKTDL